MAPVMTKEPEKGRRPEWRLRPGYRNVGGGERSVRFGVGAVSALGMMFAASFAAEAVLGIVAAAGLLTALTGYCPANRMIGRNSYRGP